MNKIEKCTHNKHLTPEIRQSMSDSVFSPSMDLIISLDLLAKVCVDCSKDISNLDLLKINV